jgi:hypothetical protein
MQRMRQCYQEYGYTGLFDQHWNAEGRGARIPVAELPSLGANVRITRFLVNLTVLRRAFPEVVHLFESSLQLLRIGRSGSTSNVNSRSSQLDGRRVMLRCA